MRKWVLPRAVRADSRSAEVQLQAAGPVVREEDEQEVVSRRVRGAQSDGPDDVAVVEVWLSGHR